MSIYEQLKKNIENVIQQYTETIAQKYQIDKKELLAVFHNNTEIKETPTLPQPVSKMNTINMDDLSVERLSKCTKLELSALCKSKSLKCTGVKDVLLQRLLGKEENTTVSKVVVKTKPQKVQDKKPSVVESLISKKENKLARRNEFGNYFYPGTRIVLNEKAIATGIQEDDGTVSELTDDSIEECKKYKITYKIPTNLDKKIDLENIKIDEIEDEEELEEIEEEDDE